MPAIWDSIKNVAGPFSLAAFFIAAVVTVWVNHLRRRELSDLKILENATGAEKVALADKIIGIEGVSTNNLTKVQRYDLALRMLKIKLSRFRWVTVGLVILACISGFLVWTWLRGSQRQASEPDKTPVVVAPAQPQPDPSATAAEAHRRAIEELSRRGPPYGYRITKEDPVVWTNVNGMRIHATDAEGLEGGLDCEVNPLGAEIPLDPSHTYHAGSIIRR